MNQKDYKKIAEAIKRGISKEVIIKNLVDYFEEEGQYNRLHTRNDWNKKQFLKDCGVKQNENDKRRIWSR